MQNQSGHNPTDLLLAAERHQSDQHYIPLLFCLPVSLYFRDVQMHKQLLSAGCDRDIIRRGAEQLGWELDDLLNRTLQAMKSNPNY